MLRWTALVVPFLWMLASVPVQAQTCPTSGAGTTCFGGQLYCASSGQCYNQPTCASNQVMDCSACGCVCNTALYPCGGCTAASSTTGASCSSPTGGQYANQCGTCACPSGTTLCPSSNSCVANRTCPAGTTWDPCTDTCGTPNVLLSPGFTQNGFINIAGDVNERAGNIRLDYSTAFGQGDLYMGNGKSLRVDGSGVTTLNVANYGSGGTGLNVNFPTGSQLCFGGACRNSWPSTTDFDPVYVNASGADSMTGPLTITGAGTSLILSGASGLKLDVNGAIKASTITNGSSPLITGNLLFQPATGTAAIVAPASDSTQLFQVQNASGAAVLDVDTTNMRVGIGTAAPAAALDVAGTGRMSGFQLTTGALAGRVLTSDGSGNGTWLALPASIGGSGTTGRLPKFTSATTIGDSAASDTGSGLSVAGTAALGGYALSAANNGQGGGTYVTTNSTLNGVAALRVINSGAGAGLDVDGGSAGDGAFIKGAGGNVALDVASYNYPGATSVGTVMQVRRGTGSGVAPAAGMGTQIGFPLQSDSAGSYSQGGGFGAVISSLSPWKTDMFFSTVSGSTQSEKMRITGDGRLGIGTTAPDRGLTLANATGANYMNVKDGTHELLMGVDSTGGIISVMTNHDLVFRAGSNSEKMRVTAGGNVGVGATAPAARLSVGGNGANVYGTDLWVENNMHVQGNEAMAQGGGRGRLRVGTAWGYPGMYAETASNGSNTDLVLGASSDHVLINASAFGRPGASATLELWGSRISDTGSGTLHIQSGGSVVAFDGGDTVVVNNALQLGGVARTTWPSLSIINSGTTLYTWQGSGWKSVSCPSGYGLTGWSGYNCESNGGQWECSSAYMHSTYVDIWYSAEANAYVSINCAALN